MTELTNAATVSHPDRARTGAVGTACPGIEVRLARDGEVLVRGPLVMRRYCRDPAGTADALDRDGWLHTGDLGTLDTAGFLTIVDRKKELIITSGGKNISPALIESLLQRHPLIGQACAIGDRRNYVTALLVLDGQAAPDGRSSTASEPAPGGAGRTPAGAWPRSPPESAAPTKTWPGPSRCAGSPCCPPSGPQRQASSPRRSNAAAGSSPRVTPPE